MGSYLFYLKYGKSHGYKVGLTIANIVQGNREAGSCRPNQYSRLRSGSHSLISIVKSQSR